MDFTDKYALLLNQHRRAQGVEREKLAKHRTKCFKHPKKYLGICIDGMDQKKTELPHFIRCPKNMDEKYFIAIHVVGCLIFNKHLNAKVFLNYLNFHNDSNLTIHVIQQVLNTWEGNSGGNLPPVLYLQLDNIARENKNKFLMAYLNMLVQLGVFQKIKVGFLLVGHTHDQIDQMFSKFSAKAFRLDTLVDIIKDSYKPKAEVIFVEEVADFRKFVSDKDQPNAEGVTGNVLLPLHGISSHKQFHIRRTLNEDGSVHAHFHAKHLSTTSEWGEQVEFIRYIPSSTLWVAPQMALKSNLGAAGDAEDLENNNIGAHLATLGKYKKAIEEGFNYFEDDDKLWWLRFFDQQKEIIEIYLKSCQWHFEWVWPSITARGTIEEVETRQTIEPSLREKVAGVERVMYSGSRKRPTEVGDYRDLEVGKKYAMIYVAAHEDPYGRPFWMAKVLEIISSVDEVPKTIRVGWYTMTSHEEVPLDGKYYLEKDASSNKLLEDVIVLGETSVFAYNFALLGNHTLPAKTKRIIQTALLDTQ